MIKNLYTSFTKLNVPTKAAIVYTLANILQKALSFLTSPIFTRLLTLEQYGKVAVFLSYQDVIGIIAMFCLQGGVFNNGMVDFPDDRDEYTFSLLVFSNCITAILGVVFIIFQQPIISFTKLDTPLLCLMFLYFLLQPAFGFWITKERYEYKYKLSTIANLCMCLLAPIISILAIKSVKGNAVYLRLYGYFGTFFIFYIAFYAVLFIKAKGKIQIKYWKYAFTFNIVLIPHYLSVYVLNSSDRIMISRLLDDSLAAKYSLAYSLSAILIAIWTAINSSLIPATYEKCIEKRYKEIGAFTVPIVLVFLVLALVLTLFAPELIMLLSTKDYYDSVNVVPPIVIGVFFQAMYFIFANIVYYYKKPKYVMVGSFISAALNILLNYIFIPKFGYVAAGYTTLFSYLIQALIDYYAMTAIVKEEIYNKKILFFTATLALLVAIACPILYKHTLIRYFFVVIICISLIYNRKIVITIIKKKN